MHFKEMSIEQDVLMSLETSGYSTPTLVQEKTIPILKTGKDLICQSETGSGKTLAFAIPIMEKVRQGSGLQALIVTPTRELALQMVQEFNKISKRKGIRVASIYGGVAIDPQIHVLQHSEIVIGTPGRILDHLGRGTMHLARVKHLVLDEADRMLDMGFIEDVEKIIRATPKERQTILCSATIPDRVGRLAHRYMFSPEFVRTRQHVKQELLPQFYYDVTEDRKFSLLAHLIKEEKPHLGLVFCNRRTTADIIAKNLSMNGVHAYAIHGGMSQTRRESLIREFKGGGIHILVATDLASRGLDIPGISHIFNYDISEKPDDYIHRIGRTARAGKSGKAIALLCQRDYDAFRRVMSDPKLNIQRLEAGPFPILRFLPLRERMRFRHSKRHYQRQPRRW